MYLISLLFHLFIFFAYLLRYSPTFIRHSTFIILFICICYSSDFYSYLSLFICTGLLFYYLFLRKVGQWAIREYWWKKEGDLKVGMRIRMRRRYPCCRFDESAKPRKKEKKEAKKRHLSSSYGELTETERCLRWGEGTKFSSFLTLYTYIPRLEMYSGWVAVSSGFIVGHIEWRHQDLSRFEKCSQEWNPVAASTSNKVFISTCQTAGFYSLQNSWKKRNILQFSN